MAPQHPKRSQQPEQKQKTDRELFFESLALFEQGSGQPAARVIDADVDVDAFVERALGNVTLPPA